MNEAVAESLKDVENFGRTYVESVKGASVYITTDVAGFSMQRTNNVSLGQVSNGLEIVRMVIDPSDLVTLHLEDGCRVTLPAKPESAERLMEPADRYLSALLVRYEAWKDFAQ